MKTAKEIIDKCTELKLNAICRDEGYFEECNYEWEIGARLNMILQQERIDFGHSSEVDYIMGIPVRINVAVPERIKLWKEIKT